MPPFAPAMSIGTDCWQRECSLGAGDATVNMAAARSGFGFHFHDRAEHRNVVSTTSLMCREGSRCAPSSIHDGAAAAALDLGATCLSLQAALFRRFCRTGFHAPLWFVRSLGDERHQPGSGV